MEQMTPEQRGVYDAVVSGPRGKVEGPLRAALHRPDLADKWQQFGAALRYGTSLAPRLSELAILLTARAWDSPVRVVRARTARAQGGSFARFRRCDPYGPYAFIQQ